MTSIAILSDIHGNVPAMEAVLADLARQDVDEILVGGDLVGRGPEGSKVVRRIRDLGWSGVRGNHEDYLLTFRRGAVPGEWLETDEWAASRWMAEELTDEGAVYIDTLPLSLTARSAPELCLVHGTPRSNGEGLGPWSTDRELEDQLGQVPGKVLVCAHTHRPMRRDLPSGMVVNVGAVGLPFNRDQRAQYAILRRSDDGAWDVEPRQVSYDLEQIFRVYRTSGFLDQGGVTACLLRLELEHAAPFLVPFLRWAETLNLSPEASQIDSFLEFYDLDEPMRTFMRRLRTLR